MQQSLLETTARWLTAVGILFILLDNVLYRERGMQIVTLYTFLGIWLICFAATVLRVDRWMRQFRRSSTGPH